MNPNNPDPRWTLFTFQGTPRGVSFPAQTTRRRKTPPNSSSRVTHRRGNDSSASFNPIPTGSDRTLFTCPCRHFISGLEAIPQRSSLNLLGFVIMEAKWNWVERQDRQGTARRKSGIPGSTESLGSTPQHWIRTRTHHQAPS